MVTRYCFSEKLGPILYGSENQEVFLGRDYSQGRNYSENVASEIDAEVRELIETGYEKAKDILTIHGDMLERCAQYLMKHEKIDGADFYKLMANEIDTDGNEIMSDGLIEKKCEKCGEPLSDGDSFCPKCGALSDSGEQSAQSEAAPEKTGESAENSEDNNDN